MLLGGTAAAWSLGVRAQQPEVPVIGVLNSGTRGPSFAAFRQGLNDGGYVEGRNVAIEFRNAGGQYDRLPAIADDLVRRQVTLIAATGGSVSALAAKTATATIPIVFIAGLDPVETGLVSSLNRPGGNATGVSVYTADLVQKRLELLRDLVPGAATIALLVSSASSAVKFEKEHLEQATRRSGLKLLVLEAGSESDFEPAFASAVEQGAGAILISADPYFTGRRAQIVALATRYRLPAAYPWRAYAEAGGLMSYGPPLAWAYKQIGTYASRILKGVKPGDLPVQLPTTFELVINLETAKALGLTVSKWLLASADEVIE